MLKEVPVENYTDIPRAIANGANRIELCDNLAVGGTTVSHGVMAESQKYASEHHIPVMAMIRPRGGNFVYNDIELKMMEADLFQAQQLGVDGAVFGALTPQGTIDEEAMEQLIGAAGGMQITFHMAFDAIPVEHQAASIDWLIDHDVDRILTHGGPLTKPIEDTLSHLKETVEYAKGRIIVMPGGGVTVDNAAEIAEQLHVPELHGSKLV
ncbi:copper homeostasis protein CutC [Pediococcus acidilactici]|uniref:copper homeostasis protein CutC n=1 Tax=Pediococcus acidilactici TaxID=1254 RepID=UPI001869C05B|nr:copper homeostasis protein CutC [Pediococcus acidilactici]MBM6586323.1 copper homeostasis protein CutC [Pediococcus acidilactici]MBS9399615.1 copper homeostasis protein CutC [Pediococcus acidilactici]MCH9267216.1 copper homeostasis protein CutC [Pediococcus acidilactici]MCK2074445.1 copper homeostasis protein CutC [Pediococcus acidilactici]MDV2602748.1 copper homeostasis protein CutC [Pediococcus acidilactici]